jgi:ABC-type polar amino acid transport system ATPase subunit
MLDVHDAWKSFGALQVLRGVDLHVGAGEVVCLLGRSGSGKTTLLRCINHLEEVDAGVIRVDGALVGYRIDGERLIPLKEKHVALRRREIGMVFQQFHLFPHLTVLENVTYAPVATGRMTPADAEETAHTLLQKVGLAGKVGVYPVQLSGGQQQRVAIARALAMRPKLMLFDEPTSALDPDLVRDVLDVMRALAEEKTTMLVVTHELGFAREVADRVAFIARGKIVETAAPAEFFSAPRTSDASEYLQRQL